MDVLLIGGASGFANTIINKLNKEGNRVFVLSEEREILQEYKGVFEKYYFAYDNKCIMEIMDSIKPDIVIFMGAYDINFDWQDARNTSLHYSAGLLNILMAFSILHKGKFIYLSNEEVFSVSNEKNISEIAEASPIGFKAMAISEGERLCESYSERMKMDNIVLRLDHVCDVPKSKRAINNICARMCLAAIEFGVIRASKKKLISILHPADAVEAIYAIMKKKEHKEKIYHLSSCNPITEFDLASMICDELAAGVEVVELDGHEERIILSNHVIKTEFRTRIVRTTEEIVETIAKQMKRNRDKFADDGYIPPNLFKRAFRKTGEVFRALFPFFENCVCFIPFFMLNNRAVGSQYFTNLDFYLLYVLLFAIIYGQQQATFSAVLAVAGYCFRQMYNRSGFDVMLDYNTYVWIAQLFILGLVVGYMRDQLKSIKGNDEREMGYLSEQINDIQEINSSNVRIKDILETQIVNQNDSLGKIYEITSALDKYEPEEVLFYAAEILSNLFGSEDVAIYLVANRSYARLFSSTSAKARVLGNSIQYVEMKGLYETLKDKKVYINKELNEDYPTMANAIYSEDEMQLILMIWGIPWEKMTLGYANMLTVVGYLIQNAVLRANRYIEALENQRYIAGTNILECAAFTSLVKAYVSARRKDLTECTFLKVLVEPEQQEQAGIDITKKLRQTDYLGRLEDGELYILLANADRTSADYVIKRLQEAGYENQIQEELSL